LNRTGSANKILGNQGGVQNPTVGDIQTGKEVTMQVDVAPTTEKVGRFLGAMLIECDGTSGGEISETNPPQRTVNWTKRGSNLVAWADGAATCIFWVF
jgi:hypothetical protein